MKIRKLITGVVLAVITSVMLVAAPLSSAVSVDFDLATTDADRAQGDVTEQQCAELDESLAAALGCDISDRIIDFTEYTGEFAGPDASGYDDALTTTTSARELIQTLVNFALSFLGLISTIVIIYGGVMYVTSRGDEEMATKGKKTISYAVVGIVIILASFAIVNTLIGATGGGAGDFSGSPTGTITEAGAGFDVDSVLNELTDISEEYIDAYNTLLFVAQETEFLKSIEMPLVVDVIETDISVGGFFEFLGGVLSGTDKDYSDQYTLINEDDIDEYIEDIRAGTVKIQREVDSLSDTYEATQALINYLRSGTRASLEDKSLADILIPLAFAEYVGTDGCNFRDYGQNYQSISAGIGINVTETNISEIDSYICPLLDDILSRSNSDYEEKVTELVDRTISLQELFDTAGQTSSSLLSIRDEFADIIFELERTIGPSGVVTASTTRDILEEVGEAYVAVQNVKFVNAVMNLSTTRGNAPLVVRLDALGSTDPTGNAILDENIQWDLDGDGKFDGANDAIGPSVSFTYDDEFVGTIPVKVRIFSSDDNIAAGIARGIIIVEPRSSAIIITASAGGEDTDIADFSEFPFINKDSYKVTLSEAQSGIKFDAINSTGAGGSQIEQWSWDFGDRETLSGGTEAASPTHLYGEAGQYTVELTVTDATRIEDRHIFVVYVDSPAARIEVTPDVGEIGTKFKLSGGGSTTDTGTIVSYLWSASPSGPADFDSETGSNVEVSFDSPGVYTVTLIVADSGPSDGQGNTDDASINLLVSSQTPDAKYDFSVPNNTEPGTYLFDASDSFDPDPNDVITFEWDFDGVEGEDYEILDDNNNGEVMTVRFLTAGARDVTLTVCDQHPDELQQCEDALANINVTSVLDVELTIQAGATRRLDDSGVETVAFQAFSSTAAAFEIDFGDGETAFEDVITNGFANFSHDYEQAGVFNVTLIALDEAEGRNSMTRRVYIASGDSPIAVVDVQADGEDIGFGANLTGNVQTKFTFDASNSVNVDGSTSNLSYSWNFGDGTTATQKTVTKTFDELTTYNVVLTVKDKDDTSLSSETTVAIRIQGIDPEIKGITVTPIGDTLETPLKVNVSIDASDRDGSVNFVKGWYYDLNDSAKQLGTIISESTSFSLTINTKGEEGQEVSYGFAAEVTDNDNRTVNSFDEIPESEIPTLTVVNGPNESPVANFSVDRTSFFVGEEVIFSSTSFDPDGKIVEYVWDVEGDGFFNNEPQESPSLTYVYKQVHSDGVKVKLKVTDDSGATATSDELTIFIDTIADPPDAAFIADIDGFEVQFRDNSTFDTENFAEFQGIYWDFDTNTDTNGNGITDDDIDSLEREPLFAYEELGTYTVKMTVVDTTGQTDSVKRDVIVADAADPVAAFTYEQEGEFNVKFKNNSTTDKDAGADVREYQWDLDLDFDTDGDGNSENDNDSTKRSPSIAFEDYGIYTIKLTITDTFGKVDTVVEDIEVKSSIEPLTALIATVPQANANGQIIMIGDFGDITIFYNAEGGSGDYSFQIDKNIFFDTSGDNVRENDLDHTAISSGSWKTGFDKSWGQIVIKLTVIDEDTGETSTETIQVVFQGTLAEINLFNATPSEMIFLILSAMLSAILGISLVFRFKPVN